MSIKINRWGLHSLFQSKYRNWQELEQAIGRLQSNKEKGDAFEQLAYFYFCYHKDWYGIREVWCDKVRGRSIPTEIRRQYKLEKKDYGVDGANLLVSGEIEAWQGKFRLDRSHASYTELATFWTEAEHADSRRIIANSTSLPFQAAKKQGHKETLIDKFLELEEPFFDALQAFATEQTEQIHRKRHTPRPHQQQMINDVVAGLSENSRGKLIAACGVGKTLAALWITEHKDLAISRVLVLAPSIALVGQTLKEWTMHRSRPFSYLAVCSDQTIAANLSSDDDFADVDPTSLGVSVTTTPEEVGEWLRATKDSPQYIFSTYHSIDVIKAAVQDSPNFEFDIIIFDEAHRTVGRGDQRFGVALKNENVPAKKRLFMTATQRLVHPRIVSLAEQAGQEVFSMSDESTYGPTLHEYNFGMAIRDGVIADYEIVLAEVTGQAEQDLTQLNRYVQLEAIEQGETPTELTADQLFKAGFLLKAIRGGNVVKVVTFHSKRSRAVTFNRVLNHLIPGLEPLRQISPYTSYVLGTHTAAERAERIANFEQADVGILSNVQVLAEGVDIPLIDSVYFVDPKSSLIDLVQAIGRALRKPMDGKNDKVASIIVPILVPSGAKRLDDINWDETLQTFHNVIQAMRDQDQRLEEQIDEINLFAISGGKQGIRIGSGGNRIRIAAPGIRLLERISLEEFLNKITVRIATANANPEGAKLGYSHLGKGERKSEYKPIFGILGDYNPEPYRESLVEPTLARFPTLDSKVSRKLLKVNNNNVSHTKRLGLIKDTDDKQVELTTLGKDFLLGRRSFNDIFKNQMLLYSTDDGLYPYRVLLSMLLELEELNHIEFLYGPYIIQHRNEGEFDIVGAARRIHRIRDTYPNIDLINRGNRDEIRQQFNAISPVDIPDHDVWGDRSTPKNKFRYAKNALALFDSIEESDGSYATPIRLKSGRQEEVRKLLEDSNPVRAPVQDYYGEWFWLE